MKLTYQEIETAALALQGFNPECSLSVKVKLARNLRKLQQALQEKEQDRMVLQFNAVKDRSRMGTDGKLNMTAEEMQAAQEAYRALMRTDTEVDLHPIPIYDGSLGGEKPKDGIDLSATPMPNVVLQALVDVVLVEA